MYYLILIIAFIPFCILFPCIVKGKKNLPKGKCIVCCNHLTNVDVCYMIARLGRKIKFLGKKELLKKKMLSPILKWMGMIPIDREKVELSTIKTVLTLLKNNKTVGIFPEGTRNKIDTEIQDFKDGVAMFAIKTGAPVVPMVIKKRAKIFRWNKIIIGEPIYFDKSYNSEDGIRKATEEIKQKMIEIQKQMQIN